jgi:DNA-directed RNA polymerase specialized sigma24 family protein
MKQFGGFCENEGQKSHQEVHRLDPPFALPRARHTDHSLSTRSLMNTQLQNDAIIVSLLSGNKMEHRDAQEAARLLYLHHLPMADAYLQIRVGIRSQILREEILVETIERVTSSITRFDPRRSKFTTFLIGYARLVAMEMLRRECELIELKEFDEKDILEASHNSMNTKALLRDLLVGRYAACLESLDDKYRVLIQIAVAGQPPEAYQRLFHVTNSTYRKRRQRAIMQLRERILLMNVNTQKGESHA